MATIEKRKENFILTLFRSLSGKQEESFEEEEEYDPKELEALNRLSDANTHKLEEQHGEQYMYVEDEETDRLGNKKPTRTPVARKEKSSSKTSKSNEIEKDDDYIH